MGPKLVQCYTRKHPWPLSKQAVNKPRDVPRRQHATRAGVPGPNFKTAHIFPPSLREPAREKGGRGCVPFLDLPPSLEEAARNVSYCTSLLRDFRKQEESRKVKLLAKTPSIRTHNRSLAPPSTSPSIPDLNLGQGASQPVSFPLSPSERQWGSWWGEPNPVSGPKEESHKTNFGLRTGRANVQN